MSRAAALIAHSADLPLKPGLIERRAPGPADVVIDILYCGICHTDLHTVRNDWGGTAYPIVAGHEIVGRVRDVGADVKHFKTGDMAGVGCIVDSCRVCEPCVQGEQQFCTHGFTGPYGGVERQTGKPTMGGFSKSIVVDEHYTFHISPKLDPAGAAPLLCAGVTAYAAYKHWKVGRGQKIGVVGLGGLGHLGVKFACAMGADVVVFTTTPAKVKDALALGACEAVVSTDRAAMKTHRGSLDFIYNTVAAAHDLNPYVNLLRRDATMALVGAPPGPHAPLQVPALITGRRSIAGSPTGSIRETQEMLDFCAAHSIVADIETIAAADIEPAFERMAKNDVRYRFVVDLATLS